MDSEQERDKTPKPDVISLEIGIITKRAIALMPLIRKTISALPKEKVVTEVNEEMSDSLGVNFIDTTDYYKDTERGVSFQITNTGYTNSPSEPQDTSFIVNVKAPTSKLTYNDIKIEYYNDPDAALETDGLPIHLTVKRMSLNLEGEGVFEQFPRISYMSDETGKIVIDSNDNSEAVYAEKEEYRREINDPNEIEFIGLCVSLAEREIVHAYTEATKEKDDE